MTFRIFCRLTILSLCIVGGVFWKLITCCDDDALKTFYRRAAAGDWNLDTYSRTADEIRIASALAEQNGHPELAQYLRFMHDRLFPYEQPLSFFIRDYSLID